MDSPRCADLERLQPRGRAVGSRVCAAALWAWLWHCPVAGPGGWWLGLHTHHPPVQTEAWAAGRLASRARSLFLGDRQEPKEGSDPFRFWLLLRPVVPLGPLSLATGVTSPRPVPPPGPVAMQLGLAGGWRHTDALFCLLGRPGMSERATSFRPRKGPPGAMVFSQFPCENGNPVPPTSAGGWHTLSRAQAHGRSARRPLRACPGLRGCLHSPRAGLPSLSPDRGWPSDTSSFSAVLPGKSGASLPLQLSVSTRARAAPAILRGQGVGCPQLGSILVSMETANSGCLLAASWVLGGEARNCAFSSEGQGTAGESGRTPLGPGGSRRVEKRAWPCKGASASSPQGECGLRPCGGASPAHRPARRGRHLLRELQDHARVEICESPGSA